MSRVLFVFGTRPEAIKLAPLALKMRSSKKLQPIVCVSAQHREMLDQVLDLFHIQPDYDLDLMKPGQSLEDILVGVFSKLPAVLAETKPDLVMVQGDTTTTFAAAMAAYCRQIAVGHVEAGLRTMNKYSPFPEEINRRLTSCLADYNFAPTETNRQYLLREGFADERIWITGNTVIDALLEITSRPYSFTDQALLDIPGRLILVTAHRRESFGEPFRELCQGLAAIAKAHPEDTVIYPVHLNPNVRRPVQDILAPAPNVRLIEPLSYEPFVHLMKRAHIILTDSGGVQEEAPSLGVPVLVMRETTERPEGVDAGTVKLVGTSAQNIFQETERLLTDQSAYQSMAQAKNPYGDGTASQQICDILEKELG